MGQSYWIIAIFWVLYFAVHSLLAANGTKKSLIQSMPWLAPKYRLLYSVVAILPFLFFILFMVFTKHTYLFDDYSPYTKIVGLMLATYGVIIGKKAFAAFSFREFIGTKQEQDQKLITDGLHGRMRHPLYTAFILLFTGLIIYMPTMENLITWACVIGYLPIGIALEERKLIKIYGQEYLDYKKNVPMLFPKIKF